MTGSIVWKKGRKDRQKDWQEIKLRTDVLTRKRIFKNQRCAHSIVSGHRSHLRALRAAEDEVGFAIPEVESGKLTTFGKTVDYVRRKVAEWLSVERRRIMTDEEALKKIDRQEKRLSAAKCGRGIMRPQWGNFETYGHCKRGLGRFVRGL